jgi:hypothetical protein
VRDFSSTGAHEQEVLFPAGSFFRVDKVGASEKGVLHVWMTEKART